MRGVPGETSTVKVRRSELLARIKANRETHREQFQKAMKGYEYAVREWFGRRLAEVMEGKGMTDTHFNGPVPFDHTEDYDRVIDMLSMEQRDELLIDEHEFAKYVRDDWGWKQQFTMTNSSYS